MKFSTFIVLALAFCLFVSTNAVAVNRKGERQPFWGYQGFFGPREEFGEDAALNETVVETQVENGDSTNATIEANATIAADEDNFEEIDQIRFPPWFRPGFFRRHRRHHKHEEAPEEVVGAFNATIEAAFNETEEEDGVEANITVSANVTGFAPEDFEDYGEEFYGEINETLANATAPFFERAEAVYSNITAGAEEDFEHYLEEFYGEINETFANATAPVFESYEAVNETNAHDEHFEEHEEFFPESSTNTTTSAEVTAPVAESTEVTANTTETTAETPVSTEGTVTASVETPAESTNSTTVEATTSA